MRIYVNEIIRNLKNPGIILALVIACLGVFGILNLKAKESIPFVQLDEYREAFELMNEMDLSEAFHLYEEKEYDLSDFSSEAFLNRTMKKELQEQIMYEDYLEGITRSAESLTSSSLFSNKDSFAYINAMHTAKVYEQLKGTIKITLGPSKGFELWSGNGFTGIIIVLVMLVVINELTLKDRESGQLNLLFTMTRGREVHGFIKLCVCATFSFLITIVIQTVAFFTCNNIFGMGDIMRPVQSVCGLRGCSFEVSMLGYMLLYSLMLSLAVFVISLIVFLVSSIAGSSVIAYMVISIIFGIEAVVFYLTGDNSYLAIFKEFNIVSFLNVGRYLSTYGNISFFGYPVYRFCFMWISMLLISCVLLPVNVKIYSRQRIIMVVKRKDKWNICRNMKPKSVAVLIHETYKLLICGKTLWVLSIFAVIQIISFAPVNEYFANEDAIYYKRYAKQFEGEVTDEKMTAIEDEMRGFEELTMELADVISQCSPEVAAEIAYHYQDRLKPRAALKMLYERTKQLRSVGGYIVYDTGYRLLTFDSLSRKKELTMGMTASIMLVVSLAYLFACDDSLDINRITSLTYRGGRSLFIKKFVLGAGIVLVIYMLNYLPYFLSVLSVYGRSGMGYPANSVVSLEGTLMDRLGFSIGQSIVLFMLLRYIILIVDMLILKIISKRLRSLNKTIVIGLVAFTGPLLVLYVLN